VASRIRWIGLVGLSALLAAPAHAAGSKLNAKSGPPIYSVKHPAICVETRGSRETIGDINALRSCKLKPGSLLVTFQDLFGSALAPRSPRGPTGPAGPVGATGPKACPDRPLRVVRPGPLGPLVQPERRGLQARRGRPAQPARQGQRARLAPPDQPGLLVRLGRPDSTDSPDSPDSQGSPGQPGSLDRAAGLALRVKPGQRELPVTPGPQARPAR
jgi:hypothetical protein